MKHVWKCDFCSHTNINSDIILKHEETCSFNPLMKSCYTCEHSGDEGYDFSIPTCELDLDIIDGQKDGNCKGWKPYDISLYRKLKIKQLEKVIKNK